MFKNYENEYIGWSGTVFYEFFGGTVNDKAVAAGTGGTGIAVEYESPLLRFSRDEGESVIFITHRHRCHKGSDTVTFTLYELSRQSVLVSTTTSIGVSRASVLGYRLINSAQCSCMNSFQQP